ncbi:small GTP-binding protein [Thermotoga sp. TBGT1765]|jgi:GTP-binding protein HflX|nr:MULTISPECIES: GTPase HflX [unclassified Thermotoga]AIY87763.1 small GTP-binding protein [Thermotoga sp. Cell2]KHC92209.1 small GTP-binding protein [Thermotoga sp. TBGT1765]KHC93668.1 small GTP-binding protein [Thermotoga sp. TBGT1766]KHC96290.1 small GTP-binding protein [Thermotoga sp. Xyl54]
MRSLRTRDLEGKKAVIVAVGKDEEKIKESLEEMKGLCKTLGVEVVEWLWQKRAKPDPATYLGKGKLQKLKEVVEFCEADLVVVDDEITPVQYKNMQEELNIDVLDRTQVILEIFARHATSEEGKLQVEMASLLYELPRLVGKGEELSRLGGGIGTRGPGEPLLEVLRRHIKNRIAQLRKRLKEIEQERNTQRKQRLEKKIPHVSIVGYTNAGKSTLLKVLTDSDVYVADKLFATLEPVTRRLKLKSGRVVLVSDTVGFIRKLPHTIVSAFKATLEEIKYSDVLIHLVDASDPYLEEKMKASERVLEEIGADKIPRILVFNKIDLCPRERIETLKWKYPEALFISAEKRIGLDQLLDTLEEIMGQKDIQETLKVPLEKIGQIYALKDRLEILNEDYGEGYALITLKTDRETLEMLKRKVAS